MNGLWRSKKYQNIIKTLRELEIKAQQNWGKLLWEDYREALTQLLIDYKSLPKTLQMACFKCNERIQKLQNSLLSNLN